MEENEVDSSSCVSWQMVEGQEVSGETMTGPLLVAMQPGSDVPAVEAVEVVVMTENGQELTENDIQTVVDANTGEVVAIGAIEEVQEERLLEAAEFIAPSDNKGFLGDKSVAQSSDESSDDDSSESESDSDSRRRTKKPKQREFAYRLQWKGKDMQDAMKSVNEKKMTIRGAAKKFRVPYSTLKDRVHGRVKHGTKPGVKTALSPEEEEDLVRYIKDMEGAGFQMRCIDVRDRAGEILQLNHGHNSPYKDGSPGHNWLAGFLKRHPGLEFKKAMNRSVIPSLQKQKAMCRRFFDVTSQMYKKHRLGHKPERVFTVTEMRVNVFLDATILMCAAADGTQIPPFVIFRGQRLKLTSARDAYPDAFFTCSYDGRVNDVVLLWWFRDHFLKKIPSSSSANHRPCVLYLSRSVGDVTFQLAQLAREERIHIVSIPPGISHLLQPLDGNLAAKIENAIAKKAKKWEDENAATPFTQKVLAQILQKVWRKGIDPVEITTNFAANGVFPCNSLAISNERIIAACQALKEQQKSPSPSLRVSNNQFSGLSLLSALSSHEYATLEQFYDNSDVSPNKAPGTMVEVETYESVAVPETEEEAQQPVVDHIRPSGKRKRSHERHADRERHKKRVTQEIEKIIEEAKGRTSSSSVTDHVEQSVLATLMSRDSPTKAARRASQTDDEQPTITQELLGAKENFEQINRAIESIGGSIEQPSISVTGQTAVMVEEVVEEEELSAAGLDNSMIKVYDQDGNEVMVQQIHDVMTTHEEEVVSEVNQVKYQGHHQGHLVDDHQVVLQDETLDGEEVVQEEVVQEDSYQLQHQVVAPGGVMMEQIMTTQSAAGEEVIMHTTDSAVSMVTEVTSEAQYIDQDQMDPTQVHYTETMSPDQLQFLDTSTVMTTEQAQQQVVTTSDPQQLQLFSEEEVQQMIHDQQQQQQQDLQQVIMTTSTAKSRGTDGPKVRILRPPQIKVVKPPKVKKPAPRIIKLVQAPGSNAVQLNMAQLQQILQLSGNQTIISASTPGVASSSSSSLIQGSLPTTDRIVMLPEDCVQEVVLE